MGFLRRRCVQCGSPFWASERERPLTARAFDRFGTDMAYSTEGAMPILAAGGIVLRDGSRPRIAIVRLRRDKSWVLPKGKLYPGEARLLAPNEKYLRKPDIRFRCTASLAPCSIPWMAG